MAALAGLGRDGTTAFRILDTVPNVAELRVLYHRMAGRQ